MSLESANPEFANRGEWLERKVLRNGVSVRGVRYNSDDPKQNSRCKHRHEWNSANASEEWPQNSTFSTRSIL